MTLEQQLFTMLLLRSQKQKRSHKFNALKTSSLSLRITCNGRKK